MNPFAFPAIGLDISDESFKFLKLSRKQDHQEIDFFGSKELESGIVELGELKDPGRLALALKSGLFDPHVKRSQDPYVVFSLPEEKGFLRIIRIQRIPLADVRQALEFQLDEHIPYPPAELVFDYRVLDPYDRGKQTMDVVVTAYPRVIVESYANAISKAGFIPVVAELESQAIARAVVPADVMSPCIIGDVGRTRTTFSIVFQKEIYFTSTVKIGGRDIDKILVDSLHITEDEARDVKVGRGFDISSEEIIRSLSPAITALKEEVDRQVGFWERRYPEKGAAIDRIYLCGGDALLRGLPEFLTQELRIPAERARIWENVFDLNAYIPPIEARHTVRYATVFGLAMRGGDIFAHSNQ